MAGGIAALQAALPDYEIQSELGRGAMGVVYLANHRALNRAVAIKQLPPAFAADAAVRDRFLSEAQTVASLKHPHVVVIHDFVDRDGQLALVMEHLPNGTVWDQFLYHGLNASRACGLVLATLAGVSHAHERGVLHRDIKPENLIFDDEWQLKVTDFGIAQMLSGRATMGTETGAIVGTPAYMAPEQADGRVCGPPADVYAAGAMLYEMLSGSLPFAGYNDAMAMATARLTADPPHLGSVAPSVPEPVVAATMAALTRAESDRYPSAEAFGVALAEAAAESWGPEWMLESGTAVRGSAAIEAASRTTRPRSDSAAAAAAAAPAPDPRTADTPSDVAPVVPKSRHRVVGANLNSLAPSDIVSLREIRQPGNPAPFLVIGLILLAAAAVVAGLGRGANPEPTGPAVSGAAIAGQLVGASRGPIPVDMTDGIPMTISDADGLIDARFLGIPVGQANLGGGVLGPGYLRYTTAGVVELVAADGAGTETMVPVRVTNSPYPTAPFVIAAMLALGAAASVSSNLRGLRARRIRIGPYVGLLVSGALLGAAAAVLAMLVLETPASLSAVINAAALGAAGCAVFGEGFRRWYRSRRLKRLVVAGLRR